jgi:hypothetical protein
MGAVFLLFGRHRDEMARGASNDFDLSNHKPVVEGNSHIGSDYILVGWIDSSFRNLHVRARCKILLPAKWCTYIATIDG